MVAVLQRSAKLLAGLCCGALALVTVPPPPAAAAASSKSTPVKRWAQFELSEAGTSGDLQAGKTVGLGITLGGVTPGAVPVVAICESVLFESQTVTLEPDGDNATLQATVTLEPLPLSRTSVQPKAARIQVTFARFRQNKFERFMRRIVYVTLGDRDSSDETTELPQVRSEEPAVGESTEEDVPPDAIPVTGGTLAEEDLLPLAEPERGKAYWKYVSHLVSRSWAKQVRGVRRGPSSETVNVYFRLYPNGRAQLIQIEKGSGAREINEAGIYAIVHAQPFPPFPAELGDAPFDVHVRMRTGMKPKLHDVQSVTNQSNSGPDAPAPVQGK